MIVDEKGSDCGTKMTFPMLLTDKNKSLFLYRYILERGKLVFLDDEVINNYIGKIINLRTPLYCKNDKYCSKCAGELYYKIGISNVGLLTTRIGTFLKMDNGVR